MKKNDVLTGTIQGLMYPGIGILNVEDSAISVKGALPGQEVEVRLTKNHRTRKEGRLLSVLSRADYEVESFCEHFGSCGGCARQTVAYDKQLALKKDAVNELFSANDIDFAFETILGSPGIYEYRNKMEYSFGDAVKGGELNLGMHKKGRFYDVVSIPQCHLVDEDYRRIVTGIEAFCRQEGYGYFNRNSGQGLLRHLVVRKGYGTGEILVGISTTSQPGFDEKAFVDVVLGLELSGRLVGIVQLVNDATGDAVKASANDKVLYGKSSYTEKLMDLTFEVSFFSFFQTNTRGAEVLYEKALELLTDLEGKVLYDLFSGTGTIGQIAAPKVKAVYGIEIVEEAVAAAKENAACNGLTNCHFIAGDVFAVLDHVPVKPDVIIVDPPRAGMMPKAVEKIAAYGVSEIVYISCNPKTMAENLVQFKELGYEIKTGFMVDLYAHTEHCETVVLLSHKKSQASSPSL